MYKDSALGNHSGDFADFLKKHRLTPSGVPCFKATADLKSSSALKSTKSPTSNTAKPRICREDKQAECEKSAFLSLRASFARVAIHTNNAKILESTFENCKHKTQSIASLEKVDSKIEAFLLSLQADLSAWQSIQKYINPLESTFEKSQKVDCHADFQSARNDGAIAASQKVDSRENAKSLNEPQNTKAQSVFDSEAAGCLMKKRGCAAFCAEISLVGFSTNKRQTPRFFAKQAKRCKPKPKQASLVKSQRLHYKKAL